jgi:hypothetical protein
LLQVQLLLIERLLLLLLVKKQVMPLELHLLRLCLGLRLRLGLGLDLCLLLTRSAGRLLRRWWKRGFRSTERQTWHGSRRRNAIDRG